MKPKHKRLLTVLLLLGVMGAAAAGVLSSFRQQLIYFYTPTELHEALGTGNFDLTRDIRVGGLVAKDSVYTTESGKTGFIITDMNQEIHASYTGLLPGLFREGQGVVAQGKLNDIGELVASTILAKHDEKYMPQEVVDALKKSGRWQEYSDGAQGARGGEDAPSYRSPSFAFGSGSRHKALRTDDGNAVSSGDDDDSAK